MNNFLCKSSINGENFQSIMFSFYCLACSTSYGHVFSSVGGVDDPYAPMLNADVKVQNSDQRK